MLIKKKARVMMGGESRGDHQKSIVISIKTAPVFDDPEPSCVALQIGMNLMMDTVTDSDGRSGSVINHDIKYLEI